VSEDGKTILGEVAHIIARSSDGPRGASHLKPDERDSLENLIYLCEKHHKIVDDQPQTFTALKLQQLKEDHERWVKQSISIKERFLGMREPQEFVTDIVHSTILPVLQLPRYIYEADCCVDSEREVKELIVYPSDRKELTPFILQGGKLIAFNDLSHDMNPFARVTDPQSFSRGNSVDWWENPVKYRHFVYLLGRCLNKFCGRKNLMLDKEHKRYFFQLDDGQLFKEIRYRPLNQSRSMRKVVYRPVTRSTGEEKKYYEHYAVNLQFHLVSKNQWCFSIRPERRFTRDGQVSLDSTKIGPRSTKRKSRLYNIDLLEEVNFWRDFFADRSPRIVLRVGEQSIVISTELMSGTVKWLGVPDDVKKFKNIKYAENLFTLADLLTTIDDDQESDDGPGEDYEQE